MVSLKLYIPEKMKFSFSGLQKETMENELIEIAEKHPIEENQFDFRLTYIVEEEDYYEVGFFIRNAVDLDLTFDVMPMHLVDGRTVIGIQMFDFKTLGAIPGMSVMPYTIKFSKENVYYPEWLDKAELRLGVGVEFKVEYTAKTDVINLDEIADKKSRNFINEKIAQLPELRIDTFDYSCLTLANDEKGNVDAMILIRNGYDKDLVLEEMEFKIKDPKGIPIYHGGFKAPCEKLEARKAVLYSLRISNEELPLDYPDYSECSLQFE